MASSNNPISLLKQGKYEEAIIGFKKQLEHNPLKQDALHFYGVLSVILNRCADGVSYLSLALSLNPDQLSQLNNIFQAIDLLTKQGNEQAAQFLLQELTRFSSKHDVTKLELARYYLLKEDPQECLKILDLMPETKSFDQYFYSAISHKLINKDIKAQLAMKKSMEIKAYHRLYNIPNANKKPRILLLYGLDGLDFHPSISNKDVGFSIYGGHFNVHMFVDTQKYNMSRLFVSDTETFNKALEELLNRDTSYDVIINCISDVEVCGSSLSILEKFCKTDIPVINKADFVLSTSRVSVYKKLKGLNLLIANTQQILPETIEDISEFMQGHNLGFPLLIRPLGSSTGIGLQKLANENEFSDYIHKAKNQALNICPFIDFKSADGLYRKYRVFVINGKIYPEHCVVHNHWNVHSSSRLSLMIDNQQLRDEEKSFVEDLSNVLTDEHKETILAIHQQLKLEYFGIDFSITPNGELLIFEANAGMRVNPDYLKQFEYLVNPINEIVKGFDGMIKEKLAANH